MKWDLRGVDGERVSVSARKVFELVKNGSWGGEFGLAQTGSAAENVHEDKKEGEELKNHTRTF